MTQNKFTPGILMAVLLLLANDAMAHVDGGSAQGFVSGVIHPLRGLDHVVAMVAVGLWGAWLGAPAIWMLPIVFPMIMAMGGVLGILNIPVPGVEPLIAISGIVLGICVAAAFKPKLWIAAGVVGCFAVFHGYAHGAELPSAKSPLAYCAGFVLATGLIHVCGIGIGSLRRVRYGEGAIRSLGAGIALIGLLFLTGVL